MTDTELLAKWLFVGFSMSLLLNVVLLISRHFAQKTIHLWQEDRDWWKQRAEDFADQIKRTP